MNIEMTIKATDREPFNPKHDPATRQAECSIRAFGIEFHSRYGVLSELRMMIVAVETWLPRGLFWHIEKIEYDSKGGGVLVTLKQRDGSLVGAAHDIASILRLHFGHACTGVYVDDHLGERIADADRRVTLG